MQPIQQNTGLTVKAIAETNNNEAKGFSKIRGMINAGIICFIRDARILNVCKRNERFELV